MKTAISLIGAEGSIGSELASFLRKKSDIFDCNFVDRKNITGDVLVVDNNSLIEIIKNSDIIIYLAGESKQGLEFEKYKRNYEEINEILSHIKPESLLIYSSTSAIYEGIQEADENSTINIDKINNYSKSMYQRENLIKTYNFNSVGLRFGSVIGANENHINNRMHIQMFKSALFTGRINVPNPTTMRPFISLEDCCSIIMKFIENKNLFKDHQIYNISAFNSSAISVASSITKFTESQVIHPVPNQEDYILSEGFSMKNDKLMSLFPYLKMISDNYEIIENLWKNKEKLLKHWQNNKCKKTCIICGNNEMIELVDLGKQPLANGFLKTKDIDEKKYPLSMYRCEKCYHNQLGYIIDPKELFTEYIYVSGTAKSNHQHFEWFAKKINEEFLDIKDKKILDVASNDGTQLDKFKELGWDTYGVDPAKNISEIAIKKGHNIKIGFWGEEEFIDLPDKFDIIVAQNVTAHVPDPVKFVSKFFEKMTPKTRLYIQTSQAELFKTGEYDTLYHEHVSFFTIKSMITLAGKCNMFLEDVEKVKIHGVSYIFKLKIKEENDKISEHLSQMIESENYIYNPYNSMFFREQTMCRKQLIEYSLKTFKQKGFNIIGFGAAAKGNTLLNSLENTEYPEYIIDDNILKQNLYSPGRQIPIVNLQKLENDTRPLAILILAWNFADDIKEKIYNIRINKNISTVLILPFPNTSNIVLNFESKNWEVMSEIKFPNVCLKI